MERGRDRADPWQALSEMRRRLDNALARERAKKAKITELEQQLAEECLEGVIAKKRITKRDSKITELEQHQKIQSELIDGLNLDALRNEKKIAELEQRVRKLERFIDMEVHGMTEEEALEETPEPE